MMAIMAMATSLSVSPGRVASRSRSASRKPMGPHGAWVMVMIFGGPTIHFWKFCSKKTMAISEVRMILGYFESLRGQENPTASKRVYLSLSFCFRGWNAYEKNTASRPASHNSLTSEAPMCQGRRQLERPGKDPPKESYRILQI